jgi:hypothetical protein
LFLMSAEKTRIHGESLTYSWVSFFHRRKYLAERIGNLSHGRYLPVKVPAIDTYRKSIHLGLLTGVHVS